MPAHRRHTPVCVFKVSFKPLVLCHANSCRLYHPQQLFHHFASRLHLNSTFSLSAQHPPDLPEPQKTRQASRGESPLLCARPQVIRSPRSCGTKKGKKSATRDSRYIVALYLCLLLSGVMVAPLLRTTFVLSTSMSWWCFVPLIETTVTRLPELFGVERRHSSSANKFFFFDKLH